MIKKFLIAISMVLCIGVASADHNPEYTDVLYPKLHNATYFIINSGMSTGSAVAIGEDTLLTATHVVRDDPSERNIIKSLDDDGNENTERAPYYLEVEDADGVVLGKAHITIAPENRDYAVIKCDCKLAETLPLTHLGTKVPMMSTVYVAGFPLGGSFTVTVGHYFGFYTELDNGEKLHKITAPIIYGNSGGPVIWFNHQHNRYEVLGIVSRVSVYRTGFSAPAVSHLGLIVPFSEMAPVWTAPDIGW